MPVCIVCLRDLPQTEFYWRKDAARYARDCKECKKLRADQRYGHHGRFERYGLTREEYDAQFERQERRCALCRSPEPGGRGEWCIDHFHDEHHRRGKWRVATRDTFRGILCHTCNIGIGQFEKFSKLVGHDRFLSYVGSRALE